MLEQITKWARKRSPWVYHINASSCNGCDIELVASLTPRYDIERFGAVLVPSPRHADVLMVTGTVNAQTKDRLKTGLRTGTRTETCDCHRSLRGCWRRIQGLLQCWPGSSRRHTRRHVHPRLPPRPEAIMYGVLKLLGEVK